MEAVGMTSLHKYLSAIALIYAIANSVFVVYKLQSLSLNIAKTPKVPAQLIQPKFDDQIAGVAWFVHVSDLHISKFVDLNRPKDFLKLCQFINEIVKPQTVILTGDLTDAKAKDKLGSRQFTKEWEIYHDTMDLCGAYKQNPLWLDVRGNHDTFNTKDLKEDFYQHFGIMKKESRMYWKSVKYNNVTYGFVAMDATLVPGPKRPFNFFGSLDAIQLENFEFILSEAQKHTDYQIVFAHYPTSCVLTPNSGLKSILGQNPNTLAYLCGHLHTLNGMIPQMYSSQPEGFLELELGDWKDNRIFRIMAIDQGQLTFMDLTHDENRTSLAILTNPMDMKFVQPQDFSLINSSTHIRALVFTKNKKSQFESVKVIIDSQDEYILHKANKSHDQLYISKWNSKKYQDQKVHTAKIILHFADGSIVEQDETKFTLSYDEDILGYSSILAKIILGFNWSLVTQAVFGIFAASLIIPLCFIRRNGKYFMSSHWRLIQGLAKVSTDNKLFYSITIATLYISLGPWALGYILDDNIGLLFPWGLFIHGHILPADVTHLYGVVFMFPYIVIMIIALALQRRRRKNENFIFYWIKINFIFVIVMILQVLHSVEFYLCYGFLATVIGLCGIGRIVFVYHLWYNNNLIK